VAEFWPKFLASKPRRPSTQAAYVQHYKAYIEPTFGHRVLASITPEDISGWHRALDKRGVGHPTIGSADKVLRAILRRALASRHIAWNPTVAVDARPVQTREMQFLTAQEVRRLADATPDRYRTLVYVLAYGGLRIGEAVGLRLEDLDPLRGRLTVARSVTEVGGRLVPGPTKTGKVRAVSLPGFLRDMLAAHIADFPNRDGILFAGPVGGMLRPNNFRKRIFYRATKEAGLEGLRVHDLRHTCAALLFAQGAPIKAVAERLGHSRPTVTLNTYAHVIPGLDDQLVDALEQTFRAAVTYPSPEPEQAQVVQLSDR
jgi:integrase